MRTYRLIHASLAALAAFVLPACEPQAAEPGVGASTQAAAVLACPQTVDLDATAAFEAEALAAAAASRGAGVPAMWSLRDEDTLLYILGTVHLLRQDLEWRSPEIDAAIAAAQTVVFEADTSSPEAGRELMRFVTTSGMFTDGTQLTSLMTPEQVSVLKAALDDLGLPLEAVQPMRPWYAAMNMSVMQLTQEGFDPQAGVETRIQADASAYGASFEYLETVDDQLGEFARLDHCAQIEFLMLTASSMDEGTVMLDTLVSEWADGDVAGLGALMASPEAFGSRAAYDALLKNRNARWTPLIAGMLETPGTRLIAVGAGHLAGEDSVIAMLRAEGYKVDGP
ncbi:MAG: TraB/GumN family protein [Hyphomonas sp.]